MLKKKKNNSKAHLEKRIRTEKTQIRVQSYRIKGIVPVLQKVKGWPADLAVPG